MPSANRRRHPRVRARGLAAHLRTPHGRTPAQVENVSMGGLFVRTDRLEEVGTEIDVDLVKPGWKRQLSLAAQITSRVDALEGRLSKRMPGMGLQFVHVDEKQHDRLRSLLTELGVPEEESEITLPGEETEAELRALELSADDEDAEPLERQPQPLWQQVQMVEAAIAGTLQQGDLPPIELDPDSFAPPEERENARLALQVRGLVMQLSDAQQQLAARDAEIERLREELDTARAALDHALRRP